MFRLLLFERHSPIHEDREWSAVDIEVFHGAVAMAEEGAGLFHCSLLDSVFEFGR